MKQDLIEQLLSLPQYVSFEGLQFELTVFKNASDEIRLCYDIFYVSDDSPHKNDYDESGSWYNSLNKKDSVDAIEKWDDDELKKEELARWGTVNGSLCDFLFLCEGIESDEDMFNAINLTKDFLTRHNLLNND